MKRIIVLPCFLTSLVLAQGTDSILVWDNDRGISQQRLPAVATTHWGGIIPWQDGRWGDWDIIAAARKWDGTYYASDLEVSPDSLNLYQQQFVDAEANPITEVVFAWEDSCYRGGEIGPPRVMFRIFTDNAFNAEPSATYANKHPSVAVNDNSGEFALTYTSYQTSPVTIIRMQYRDRYGNLLGSANVWQRDSLFRRTPISRVALCDSGMLVVYEDSSGDGTERSIYCQMRNRVGSGVIVNRQKVSHVTGDYYNEEDPGVAVNQYGFGAVVWADNRTGFWRVYVRPFQLQPGNTTPLYFYNEMLITNTEDTCFNPRVGVFPEQDWFVAVYENRIGAAHEIWGRAGTATSLMPRRQINVATAGIQANPDVECGLTDTFYVAWDSDTSSVYDDYDICTRSFVRVSSSSYGFEPLTSGQFNTIPAIVGGRRGWYFDDENYDNPLTPGWNEDPIDEPDSVWTDLETAILDQIDEINLNGQYWVRCLDTLPARRQKGPLEDTYDVIFMDLGYRTATATAGVISASEQSDLVTYHANRFPLMVEGNDFGYQYDGTALYDIFKATYMGDGAAYRYGNVDTLYGGDATSFKDLVLNYDYQSLADNYVDSIRPRSGAMEPIFYSCGAPTKWLACRTVGWGEYWKDERVQDSFTVYSACMLSSIQSGHHPHTYEEVMRRLMGYLGLAAQPEPITELLCETSTTEGEVTLMWDIVSDDKPDDPANGPYELKFARKRITSEACYRDSTETYYQTWLTSGAVGDHVSRMLTGLPPMDTLIFALKVQDEDGLWNELGAIPRGVVAGDSVTPHTITVGANYVKDFANKWEFMDVDSGDSLFVTWDRNNIYLGFARRSFVTNGDLFIYLDVTDAGGADTSIGYNGSANRQTFWTGFKPDYCFVVDNPSAGLHYLYRYAEKGTWSTTTFSGAISEDNVVNAYEYTEVSIPFTDIAYDTLDPFRLLVLVQHETVNYVDCAYPPANGSGYGIQLVACYLWGSGLRSGLVPNTSDEIIGIEELAGLEGIAGNGYAIKPNPFRGVTEFQLGPDWVEPGAELRIYDTAGRLVRRFRISSDAGTPGKITWRGDDEAGRTVPDGVYFCEMRSGQRVEIVKVVHLR